MPHPWTQMMNPWYSKAPSPIIQKDACNTMFIAALFTIVKTWKEPKCPLTDEWINKMWYIYTMEYYSAIKKNEIMPFAATWMDLEVIVLSEVRDYHTKWSQKERQTTYDITYTWNLKYDTNEPIYETEADSQTQRTDLWLPRGSRGEGGMDWEFGISRCKPLYIERINDKVLLYRAGNYIS